MIKQTINLLHHIITNFQFTLQSKFFIPLILYYIINLTKTSFMLSQHYLILLLQNILNILYNFPTRSLQDYSYDTHYQLYRITFIEFHRLKFSFSKKKIIPTIQSFTTCKNICSFSIKWLHKTWINSSQWINRYISLVKKKKKRCYFSVMKI